MARSQVMAEVNRQYKQNRNDIEHIYTVLEKTDKTVRETKTKVDALAIDVADLKTDVTGLKTDVADLKTDVTGLKTDVADLKTKVGQLDTKVTGLETRVGSLEDKVDDLATEQARGFTRIEHLLMARHGNPAPDASAMRTPSEKRLSVLETKVDACNSQTSDHVDELRRHNRIFDVYDDKFVAYDAKLTVHDKRFDTIDNQMAEVLGILRATKD